jgi:hypothetical protein
MKQYLHPVQLLPIHEDQIATVAYLNHVSTARESWIMLLLAHLIP